MKISFVRTFMLVLLNSYLVYGFCGELRFFIDDNTSTNYKIVAQRISLNDPLFGQNFMMIDINNTSFNTVTTNNRQTGQVPTPFDFYLGFDFERDQGSRCWPFIGEGKYEISIYREEIFGRLLRSNRDKTNAQCLF